MDKLYVTTENMSPALTAPLLAWYRTNARDLPWRHTQDPYRIWVSEIMLQQTRVAAVLGYYARFMEAFPTVEALAAAPEERLMKCWEGLGYYSRARNLHRAAKLVAEAGDFPGSYEGLLALPGIGEYTAGAVASAAFGLGVPAVDGNVLRVMTRLTEDDSDIASPQTKRRIAEQVRALMPEAAEDIRVFNQALMELGATVCVPNGPPRCGVCPLAEQCLACRRGSAERLPVKAAKKARRIGEKTVFVLLRQGKTALRRREESGLLAGLWEFPNTDGALEEQAAADEVARMGFTAKNWKNKLTAKHIFTHVEWHMSGYTLEVEGEGPAELVWVDGEGLAAHAVPSAFGRYYREAEKELKDRR